MSPKQSKKRKGWRRVSIERSDYSRSRSKDADSRSLYIAFLSLPVNIIRLSCYTSGGLKSIEVFEGDEVRPSLAAHDNADARDPLKIAELSETGKE